MINPDTSFRLPVVTRRLGFNSVCKQLFEETLAIYLNSVTCCHMLPAESKHLVLVGIHGLVALGAYQLARVIVRISFSYMTADELDAFLDAANEANYQARHNTAAFNLHQRRQNSCQVPF